MADGPTLPEYSESSTAPSQASSSAEPSTVASSGPASTPVGQPTDAEGQRSAVLVSEYTAETPEAQAAYETYVAWNRELTAQYARGRLDEQALAQVATGPGLLDLIPLIKAAQDAGVHYEGILQVDVYRVEVTGDIATVWDCGADNTVGKDEAGVTVQLPLGATPIISTVRRVDGRWLVESLRDSEGCV